MNNKIYIIGIDPGASGGIVALTNGTVTAIDAMPSTPKGIYEHFLYLGFPNMINKEKTYVYMELVHAMPTDGVRSAFSFGRHMGHLDTISDLLYLNPTLVTPIGWMSYFDIQKKEKGESRYNFKKRLLQFARSRCRDKSKREQLNLKTCDAYLIALYGYYQQSQQSKKKIKEN